MRLYSDGSYEWKGVARVASSGTRRGRFDVEAYRQAKPLISDADIGRFRDKYEGGSDCTTWTTDQQTVVIGIMDGSEGSKAYGLQKQAEKLDAAGKSGGDALRSTADKLTAGAAALRSDGSDGKMANLVSQAAYTAAGGTANGAAAVPVGNTNNTLVNKDNKAGFLSGTGIAK